MANEINNQITQTISLLTLSLNIHLNLEQNLTINTSEIFMLLKIVSFSSLMNNQYNISSIIKNNQTVLFRVSFVLSKYKNNI